MVASEETIVAVRGVLDRFAATYSAKDEAGVLACFAVGNDGVLVGTGADEWRVGDAAVRAQVERDFAQADSLSVEYGELHIDGTDGVAWFAAKATVRASVGGELFESALRLTGVVSQEGDGGGSSSHIYRSLRTRRSPDSHSERQWASGQRRSASAWSQRGRSETRPASDIAARAGLNRHYHPIVVKMGSRAVTSFAPSFGRERHGRPRQNV